MLYTRRDVSTEAHKTYLQKLVGQFYESPRKIYYVFWVKTME